MIPSTVNASAKCLSSSSRVVIVHFSLMRRLLEHLPVLLISLLAAYPIVVGVPDFVDSANHFYRIVALDWHIQHFDFYPRWFAEAHYGFGAPVFNFYAPLSYYFAVAFRVFGLSLPICYALGYGLAFVIGGFGLYQWTRDLGYDTYARLIGVAAFCSAPYLYMNTIHRGAYPETWGLAIAPWVFWSAMMMARTSSRSSRLIFTLTFAALILTHNLVAFIITPLIIIYIIVNIVISDQLLVNSNTQYALRNTLKLFIVHSSFFILGIALASFYILPVALEANNVFLTRTIVQDFFYSFSSLNELFALPVHYDPYRLSNPIGRTYSLPQIALGLLVIGNWLLVIISKARPRFNQKLPTSNFQLPISNLQSPLFIVHCSFFIALTFFALPQSESLWVLFPLARFIQLPWRLLGPGAIFLALLAAAGAQTILNFRQQIPNRALGFWDLGFGILIFGILSFWVFALPWTYHRPFDPFPVSPTPADVIRHEINTGLIGTTSNGEFVPRWVTDFPKAEVMLPRYEKDSMPSHLAPTPEGVNCLTSPLRVALNEEEVSCKSSKDFVISFYRFYFPGWTATLDDKPVDIIIAQPNGNIALDVPSGQHTIKIFLQPTLPQVAGTVISLIALAILLITTRRSITNYQSPTFQLPTSNFQFLTSLFILSLFIVRVAYLDRYETVFNYTQLDKLPNPTSLNFGDQVEMIGYTIPQPVSSGDVLRFKLFWKPLPPVSDDYSVTVQLADRFGNRFGQSDSQHPDLVPTSKWRPEQYAHDEHSLKTFIGTPPGEYRLLVSVYNKTKRLNLMRDGAPAEVEYELGKVIIERGATQPKGDLRLVDYSVASRDLTVGDAMLFTTLWHSGDTPTGNVAATVSFTDSQNKPVSVKDLALSGIDYTPDKWNRNELIRYPQAIIVPPDLAAGTYRVGITLNNGARFDLGEVKINVPARSFIIPPISPLRVTNHDFNNAIRLLGYDVRDDSIILYWQSKQVVEKRLTVFVHKFEKGMFVGGHDASPTRPTTSWIVGEVITDVHPIGVGDNFEIGLYDPLTGERFGEVFVVKP
mgnify:CR=1 FL=1